MMPVNLVYNKLIDRFGIKLIDFDDFSNNNFHVVTELRR